MPENPKEVPDFVWAFHAHSGIPINEIEDAYREAVVAVIELENTAQKIALNEGAGRDRDRLERRTREIFDEIVDHYGQHMDLGSTDLFG